MAQKRGSFWSTTSGVMTGVAGTLTGVVGIATLAAQLGWVGSGGDDGDAGSPASEQAAGSSTTAGTQDPANDRSSGGTVSRGSGRTSPAYRVDPTTVSFDTLGGRTATVVVRNTGTVDVDVTGVAVDGEHADRFTASGTACTRAALAPGRSCDIDISFQPSGGGSSEATLVVEAEDAPAQEVELSGRALL